MPIGIAILPSAEFRSRIVETQKRFLTEIEIEPKLGNDENHPHLTLVQGDFAAVNSAIAAARAVVELVAHLNVQPRLSMTQIEYQEIGWIFANVATSFWIRAAHDIAFARSAPFLTVSESHKTKDISNYTLAERNNLLRFGYRYIGDSFHPHITVGQDRTRRKEILLEVGRRHFGSVIGCDDVAEAITVYEMGAHGSHRRILDRFELSDGNH